MGIQAIEQNYPYLGFGALTGISSGSKARQVQPAAYGTNGGLEAGLASYDTVNSPSVEGGSFGYHGAELRGAPVAKVLDISI